MSGPLTGSAINLLPESASSDLPVIAFGPGVIADGLDFGLVVVHGSGETVSDVEVTVIVRDRSGMEIDTFHDLGFAPDLIEPGSMAIATAVALDDQRFLDSPAITGLERTPSGLSGPHRNPHAGRLDVITLNVVCFDATGEATQTAKILLDDQPRDAGDELPFSLVGDPLDDDLPCDPFLVAGIGMYSDPE